MPNGEVYNGSYQYTVTDTSFRKRNATTEERIPVDQLLTAPAARKADRRYQAIATQQLALLIGSLNEGMQRPAAL